MTISAPFTIVDLTRSPTIHIAHVNTLVFAVFAGATTMSDLDLLNGHQLAVAKNHGKITMISLVPIQQNVGRIGDEVREKSMEIMKSLAPVCLGSATCILGKGLAASMVRMFMTGFGLVSKTPFPQRTFSTIDDALTWAQALPGQSPEVKYVTAKAVLAHFGLTSPKDAKAS